jgi:hypothetical protein
MIPGYKKFCVPPLANPANAANDPPTISTISNISKPAWVFGLFEDHPEERFAIQEYDGGLSREEAERRAGLN